MVLFSSGLRASVQDLMVRGHEATLERMTELLEPRRESAAVLFADLQSSTALARELSALDCVRGLRAAVRQTATELSAELPITPGDCASWSGDSG